MALGAPQSLLLPPQLSAPLATWSSEVWVEPWSLFPPALVLSLRRVPSASSCLAPGPLSPPGLLMGCPTQKWRRLSSGCCQGRASLAEPGETPPDPLLPRAHVESPFLPRPRRKR